MLTKKETYKTTCCYCGVGCGMIVSKDKRGNIKVEGDTGHPVNKGMLCSKGMNLHYTVMDNSDRLLYPEIRWHRNEPRQRYGWDTSLEHIASVFKSIINQHGHDAVGFYVSGQCLTEEYYVVNKLVKGFIGTNNIDTNSRLCMSSAVSAYKMSLGEDTVPISYEDIELADCFLIAGANPAWCHPILFRRIEAHKAKNPDVKIIVVDPRKTQTAAMANLHLQINPGTDVVLYNAIARGLIENGFINNDFIQQHTDGFEALQKMIMKRSLREAATICGVKFTDIYRAVKYIGSSGGFIPMWAMGLNQSVIGVNKNLALINLSLITGKIGKPGSGPFSLTGQPNAMGGREVGGLSNLLPAHRDMNNSLHRKEVADYWGVASVPNHPGLTATEMFEALHSGKMKAIWIVCTNPLVSIPNSNLVQEALQRAELVVVQDISSRSDTVKYADVVLPAAGWLEKDGTMTNSERRINYLSKVIEPPGEALPDVEILQRFAEKMGWKDKFNYQNSAQIYDEHCGLTKNTHIDISGLNHERLKKEGPLQWPVPDKNSYGTSRLFADHQFYTPDKKAKLHALPDGNHSEEISKEFPLVLTTGRIRDQWHSMTKTGKVNKLNQHIPHPFLEIHPSDAEKRNIGDGNTVTVKNERGTITVTAKISNEIKKGAVFLPMHWGKILNENFARTNNLTSSLIDPISKEPDFKFSVVEVVKYIKPSQKVIIIGGGMAAYYFLNEYRKLNETDDIHLFCEESDVFYDHSMLPDYLSGIATWNKLEKLKNEEAAKLWNIKIHPGKIIVHIDSKQKTITDCNGNDYNYDILIVASDAKKILPKKFDHSIEGLYSLHTRLDADQLKAYLKPADHIVIVGGNIVGLQLAVSLRELNMEVSILEKSERLMSSQFDKISGALIEEEIVDQQIDIIYREEIKEIIGEHRITGVELGSGKMIPCNALIFAWETDLDLRSVEAAGIGIQKGITVNEYLQTSDPDIFAIGESAQYRGALFDNNLAYKEQAMVLASYFNGNKANYYQGSLITNILNINGLEIFSLGIIEAPLNDDDYEEIFILDRHQRYYKKCIIYKDKLVGAILFGDSSELEEFRELIAQKMELGEIRQYLLRTNKKTNEAVIGKLVCTCKNIGEGNLLNLIRSGCGSTAELCRITGAGTGCGSCRPEVKMIWEKALQAV
ncbi:MAG: molybdopterin-dependent oxidoreductase [Bacteroidota bacterium]|nr:molybdopterin-dependent oxidoreductase [Bacteroidota bacterium]